jgi:predicted RNA-binding Zn ribbon-like protein
MNAWFERYVQESASDEIIKDLNDELEWVRFRHVLRKTKTGTPAWQHIVDFEEAQDPFASAAYAFAHLLGIGGLRGLKRCQMPDCGRFFIGRPNAKWCSDACGSRHRVREKRNRDRKR